MLNEFNEGGTHEQNPLGGIPQGMGNNGQMNSVEEGETKKDSFIYSNRITLTPQVIAQFNLPKSLSGKTAADATKLINNKFEGRNSKIDNNTKKAFLDRIAEAQETVKAQEQAKIQESMQINSTEVPDMMEGQIPQGMEEFTQPQQQMFDGGELSQGLSMIGASGAFGQHTGINQLTTAVDLGNTAFGKSGIDTSGSVDVDPGTVKPGMTGITGALKGAQAGSMFGPIGTGVGATIGLGAGLIGGFKAKKDALKAHQNFEIGQSNQKISNFKLGGNLGDPVKSSQFDPTKEDFLPVRKIVPITSLDGSKQYQYFYGKLPNEEGYDVDMNSHIYNSDEHIAKQNKQHPEYSERAVNYLNKTKGLLNRDITKFSKGGNMYEDGDGLTDPTKPWMLPKSTMADDPNLSGSGPLNFRKSFTGVPYATELSPNQQTDVKYTPERGRFYKESFNQLGKPQLSNDLGFTSNLNYKESQPQQSVQPGNWYDTNNPLFTTAAGNKDEGYVSPYPKAKLGETLNKAGQYIKDNYGNALRYAPVAMSAYQLSKMGKPEVEKLDRLGNRYNPQYMDEKALTNQINAETNYTANALANASNGSLGSLSNNILGMQLNKTKALSDAYSKIADVNRNENKTAQQFNLGVDQFNVGQSNQEKDINARNRGTFKTERSKLLGQIGNDLGQIGKEQVYKKLAGQAFGYSYDGEYLLKPDGTKVSEEELDSTIKTNLSSIGATEKDGKYFDTTGKEISKEEVLKMIGTQKTFNKNYQGKFSSMNTNFGNISLTNNNKQ